VLLALGLSFDLDLSLVLPLLRTLTLVLVVVDDVGWFQSSLHRGHSTLRVGRRFHYPKGCNDQAPRCHTRLADMANDGWSKSTGRWAACLADTGNSDHSIAAQDLAHRFRDFPLGHTGQLEIRSRPDPVRRHRLHTLQ
jgi:hypothetical protein